MANIINYIDSFLWDVIAYPCENFNKATFEVSAWMGNCIPYFCLDVIKDTFSKLNARLLNLRQ